MNHVRTVLFWALSCAALLLLSLALHALPESRKGFAILALFAAVNIGLLVKIVRAHK